MMYASSYRDASGQAENSKGNYPPFCRLSRACIIWLHPPIPIATVRTLGSRLVRVEVLLDGHTIKKIMRSGLRTVENPVK